MPWQRKYPASYSYVAVNQHKFYGFVIEAAVDNEDFLKLTAIT